MLDSRMAVFTKNLCFKTKLLPKPNFTCGVYIEIHGFGLTAQMMGIEHIERAVRLTHCTS